MSKNRGDEEKEKLSNNWTNFRIPRKEWEHWEEDLKDVSTIHWLFFELKKLDIYYLDIYEKVNLEETRMNRDDILL